MHDMIVDRNSELMITVADSALLARVLMRLRGDDDTVGWSVGISEWASGEDLDAPLARADKQLYEAKLVLGRDSEPTRSERPAGARYGQQVSLS